MQKLERRMEIMSGFVPAPPLLLVSFICSYFFCPEAYDILLQKYVFPSSSRTTMAPREAP